MSQKCEKINVNIGAAKEASKKNNFCCRSMTKELTKKLIKCFACSETQKISICLALFHITTQIVCCELNSMTICDVEWELWNDCYRYIILGRGVLEILSEKKLLSPIIQEIIKCIIF